MITKNEIWWNNIILYDGMREKKCISHKYELNIRRSTVLYNANNLTALYRFIDKHNKTDEGAPSHSPRTP